MNLKLFTIKNTIIFVIIGLVVVAAIGAIIYYGQPKEITEFVEITSEQKAKIEAEIADIKSKLKTCDENSEDNKCSMLNLQLGIDYQSLGLISRAITAFYSAAEAASNSYIPFSNLGSIYKNLKDYSKAEESFYKALAIQPNNPTIYTKLFEMYFYDQKKYPHEIEPFFQEAFINTNYNPNIIRLYATYGKTINDPLIEIKAWTSILQYEPDNTTAKKELEAAEKSAREQGLIQ